MAKKTAQEIVQAAKPGFNCQIVPSASAPLSAVSDAMRSVVHSKDAEALMYKYLGKNSPVTAADASSGASAPVETVRSLRRAAPATSHPPRSECSSSNSGSSPNKGEAPYWQPVRTLCRLDSNSGSDKHSLKWKSGSGDF